MEGITKMEGHGPGLVPRGRRAFGGWAWVGDGRMAAGLGAREFLGLPCLELF
jgi:hypothetical protein